MSHTPASLPQITLWGAVCLCAALYAALSFGRVSLSPAQLGMALLGMGESLHNTIVLHARLPRTIMAVCCGGTLALGGLILQTIFKNPLAEPYILGISGGAAVGSIAGLLLGLSLAYTNLCAFGGCLCVLFFVLALRRQHRAQSLLLAGVMMNAFCGALILFLISLLSPQGISSIMQWFMGNLAACSLNTALSYAVVLIPGTMALAFFGHTLNLLTLGEESARSLGLHVGKAVVLLLGASSLLISLLVTAVGPIGFIGLVVPQILRLFCGADCRRLAVGCLLFGPAFLVLCDLLARTVSQHSELPSGVVTALIGAPLFIVLQWKQS